MHYAFVLCSHWAKRKLATVHWGIIKREKNDKDVDSCEKERRDNCFLDFC